MILSTSTPIYNTGYLSCDRDAWGCNEWAEFHFQMETEFGLDNANSAWVRYWNDPQNNISSLCWRVYYCSKDINFLGYFESKNIVFDGMTAMFRMAANEQAIVNQILQDDEITYVNLLASQMYIDSVPTPLLVGQLLDIADTVQTTIQRYNARQEWLRFNSDGTYQDMTVGEWSGTIYNLPDNNIGAAPILIYIAVASVVGLALGAGAVYLLTQNSQDAALDKITSSNAWRELEQLDPENTAKVAEQIETELEKVYNKGKRDGAFAGFKTLFLMAGGAAAMYYFLQRQNEKVNGIKKIKAGQYLYIIDGGAAIISKTSGKYWTVEAMNEDFKEFHTKAKTLEQAKQKVRDFANDFGIKAA